MATTLAPPQLEAHHRTSIRQLIDSYAHCADRRLADDQMALFTENAHFVVFMKGEGTAPSQEMFSRESLRPVLEGLQAYTHTTHFNGQSIINIDPNGNTAHGETYCAAHHLFQKDGTRYVMVAHLRYHDKIECFSGTWLFAERKLYLDWSETRASNI